jgi:hypothetical protein
MGTVDRLGVGSSRRWSCAKARVQVQGDVAVRRCSDDQASEDQ